MLLNPVVVYLEQRRVPRPAGVALVLINLAAIVVLVVAVAVPTFTDELQLLIQRAPNAWQSIRAHIADFTERYPALQNALPQATKLPPRSATRLAQWRTCSCVQPLEWSAGFLFSFLPFSF